MLLQSFGNNADGGCDFMVTPTFEEIRKETASEVCQENSQNKVTCHVNKEYNTLFPMKVMLLAYRCLKPCISWKN